MLKRVLSIVFVFCLLSSGASAAVSRADYEHILHHIHDLYSPLARSGGAKLVFHHTWEDRDITARASRLGNHLLEVWLPGGIARHPLMTEDAFALMICHEVGHHFGGPPRFRGSWSSAEGQADYFATLSCMREYAKGDNNVELVKHLNISPQVKAKCAESFSKEEEIAICQRSILAAEKLTNFDAVSIHRIRPPSVNTPMALVARQTYYRQPPVQCRLDTYVAGALCSAKDGVCSEGVGARPRCWYNPATN